MFQLLRCLLRSHQVATVTGAGYWCIFCTTCAPALKPILNNEGSNNHEPNRPQDTGKRQRHRAPR